MVPRKPTPRLDKRFYAGPDIRYHLAFCDNDQLITTYRCLRCGADSDVMPTIETFHFQLPLISYPDML